MDKLATLAHLDWGGVTLGSFAVDFVGLLAGFFVILAFYAQRSVWLRVFAILSNALFIFYGLLEELLPVLVLHAILLPLNLARLHQIRSKGFSRQN